MNVKTPNVSLSQLLETASKLDSLLYREMAEAVRKAVAVIAHDHPHWVADEVESSGKD